MSCNKCGLILKRNYGYGFVNLKKNGYLIKKEISKKLNNVWVQKYRLMFPNVLISIV